MVALPLGSPHLLQTQLLSPYFLSSHMALITLSGEDYVFPEYEVKYLIQKNLGKKEIERDWGDGSVDKGTCCVSMQTQVQIPRTYVRSWMWLLCVCNSSTVGDGGRRIAGEVLDPSLFPPL